MLFKITSILQLCVFLFIVRGYVAGVVVVVWLQDTGMAVPLRRHRSCRLGLACSQVAEDSVWFRLVDFE